MFKTLMRFGGLSTLILYHFLSFLIIQLIFSILFCRKFNNISMCFEGLNTPHWILALIQFLLISFVIPYSRVLLVDSDINSKLCFIKINSEFVFLELIPIFVIPILSIFTLNVIFLLILLFRKKLNFRFF